MRCRGGVEDEEAGGGRRGEESSELSLEGKYVNQTPGIYAAGSLIISFYLF